MSGPLVGNYQFMDFVLRGVIKYKNLCLHFFLCSYFLLSISSPFFEFCVISICCFLSLSFTSILFFNFCTITWLY